MSASVPCTCGNREGWTVTMYRCNYSAFNGYHRTPSDYSEVHCTQCRGKWRTAANYVESLPKSDYETWR